MNISDVNKKNLKLILKYCKLTFGKSLFKRKLPKVVLSNKRNVDRTMAYYYYEKNIIVIYKNEHKSMIQIICSVIHEYIHYLQDIRRYGNLLTKYGYNNHPYEIEAQKISNNHKYKCKKFLKQKCSKHEVK